MIVMSTVHLLFSLVVLAICLFSMRSGRPSLLAITVIGFIAVDSIGVAIAPYLPLSDINYLNSPTFVINFQDQDLYMRQLLAHWIFFSVVLVALWWQIRAPYRRNADIVYNRSKISAFIALAITVAIAAYVRYFIFGPGLEILMGSRLSFGSTSEAIASRVEIRYSIENGQGAYLASLASKILLPIAASLALFSRLKYSGIIWLLCFSLSSIYAFQTREKSPLIATIVMFAALYLWNKFRAVNNDVFHLGKQIWLTLPVGLVFFIGGAAFYAVNFGLSWSAALEGIIARTLAIPGATETNFFSVFPNIYDFRGISNIFKIPLLGYGQSDVSIYEVAVAATGDGFSTNSSVLAVGWSGAGYIGVFIISSIIIATLMLLDRFLSKMTVSLAVLASIVSIPALVGLTSGGLADFMSWGGLISPLIIVLIMTFSKISSKNLNYTESDSVIFANEG